MNKKTSENPFYGLTALRSLSFNGKKNSITSYLKDAWKEAKSNLMFRQLFHILCFSFGDIANRHHNIFGKNTIDSGGNSSNPQWLEYQIWLMQNEPEQFIKLLPLSVEYVGLREFCSYHIKTQRNTSKITGSWGLLQYIVQNEVIYNAFINLIVGYMKGNNPFMKTQVAKFIKIPRYSNRIKIDKKTKERSVRKLQPSTIAKMKVYERVVIDISKRMEFKVVIGQTYNIYSGFNEWKQQYNKDLEFVLFSTGKIIEFDREQFTNWLNSIPAGARYRVKRRLFDKDSNLKEKWSKQAKWYTQWDEGKLKLQAEQRVLKNKTDLTATEKQRLVVLEKEAKVTTGGKTLFDYIEDLITGKATSTTIQSIIDKIIFKVKLLVICDCSGSMNGRTITIARLMTTLALIKNPTKEDLFFKFGGRSEAVSGGSVGTNAPNRFMQGESIKVKQIIDREASFEKNYSTISNLISANMGSTDLSSLANTVKGWVDSNPALKESRIEQIQEYQVFMVISDGDLNSSSGQAASLNQFVMKMKQWFGWNGIVLLWDVPKSGDSINKSGYFDNIENVIHITTYNLSTINQLFTKLDDLDIVDIYTELKAIYSSNRYELVKNNVL